MRLFLLGRGRSVAGWQAFTAQCDIDKHRLASVLLDVPSTPLLLAPGLNLSAIGGVSDLSKQDDALLRPLPMPSSEGGAAGTSGSTQLHGTLSEIAPDLPIAPLKKQDFFHDHRFGISMEAPF